MISWEVENVTFIEAAYAQRHRDFPPSGALGTLFRGSGTCGCWEVSRCRDPVLH